MNLAAQLRGIQRAVAETQTEAKPPVQVRPHYAQAFTPDELSRRVRRSPNGRLFWLRPPTKRTDLRPGDQACILNGKARILRIDSAGQTYTIPRCRVVWALHYGEWPAAPIRHINGDPHDDRIENLALAGTLVPVTPGGKEMFDVVSHCETHPASLFSANGISHSETPCGEGA